ncbi:hypothetical protein [Longimicrobium sp.]|uniref:hypothetical protein n=1 Tax=Longimicrobium sp. TaxID=2029185 RepID=UPI002BA3857C|nr:hypothetical protein [Longimicrobium sp.]HSU15602.1 hypothetical protein [Longimicrobium sp.]
MFRSLRPVRAGAALLAAALLSLARADTAPAQTAARQPPAGAVAIIAHPRTPVNGLTLAELRQVFLGEQRYWRDRTRIQLVARVPEASERRVVLHVIYNNMTEAQYSRFWTGKQTRVEGSSPWPAFNSETAREMVAARQGAITFVPARQTTTGVKVLRIDGKLPGDPGYPLQ